MSALRRLACIAVLAAVLAPCARGAEDAKKGKHFAFFGLRVEVPEVAWWLIKPKPPKKDEVKVPYVVTEMTGEGQVVGGLAKIKAKVVVEALSDKLAEAPLFGPDAAIGSIQLKASDGGAAHVARDAKGVRLVTLKPGTYTLEMEVVAAVQELPDRRKSVSLPMAVAAQAKVALTLPEKELEVIGPPGQSIESQETDAGTVVTVYGGALTAATVTWAKKAPEAKLQPVVFAEQDSLVEITRGACRVDSVITYSILQSSIDELKVKLPDDCTLLNVEGKDIRSWDVQDKTLAVTLLSPAKGSYELQLKLEKVVPQIPAAVPAPQIEVLDVEREKGNVAVAAAKGVQVEATEAKGVVQIDVKEAPEKLQQMSAGRAIHLCFRYLRRPFSVTIKADEIAAKVFAEFHTQATVGLTSMRVQSTINYTIRDAGVFHFEVAIGPDTKLVSVDGAGINNWELDEQTRVLSVDMRSKAEDAYELKIELEKELKPAQAAGKTQQVLNASVPSLEAVGVDRQRGYVVVSPLPGMKVEPALTQAASQVDLRELPAPLQPKQKAGEGSAAVAYRYIKEGYEISVNVSEVQPEVTAEVAHLVTVEEKTVKIETQIAYKIRKAGIFQLQIRVPKELRHEPVENEMVDDQSYDKASETLTLNLRSKVEKLFSVTVKTDMQLDEGLTNDIEKVKDLVIPEVQPMNVEKERGHVAVEAKTTVRLKKKDTVKGLRDIDIKDLPAELIKRSPKLSLAFHYFEPGWTLELAAEPIKPRVTVETFNFVSLGEDLMGVSASAKFNILHAGIAEFRVQLPKGATNVDIEGEEIKHKEEVNKGKAGEPDVRKITLHAKKQGAYSIFFTYEIKLEKGQGPYAYEGIQVKGVMPEVERETGYLAIAARQDVEVTLPTDKPFENLTPIDERDIPAAYREGITLPILFAFRYLAHPIAVRLDVKMLTGADVVVAVVEAAKLDTVVTEEGEQITDLVATVRNSREQYLTLQLPQEARIWHAFVGGQSVIPLTETRQGVDVTKLPIAQAGKNDQSFEVRLRYSTRTGELGSVGKLHMEFPTTNLIILRLGWVLRLPKGYDLISDSGTLKRIRSELSFEQRLRDMQADLAVSRRRQAQVEEQAKQQLKVWKNDDFNRQAIANVSQRGNAEQGAAAMRNTAQESIYTGSKPDLPSRFAFQGLILPPDRPVVIDARYIKEAMGLPTQLFLLLVFAAALAWLWQKLSLPIVWKTTIYVAVGLVFAGIRTMAEGSYATQLFWIVAAIFVVAALSLLWAAWLGAKARMDERMGASEDEEEDGEEPEESPEAE